MNEADARMASVVPAMKNVGIFRWIMVVLVAAALVLDLVVLFACCL